MRCGFWWLRTKLIFKADIRNWTVYACGCCEVTVELDIGKWEESSSGANSGF